jgi:hypothetical protein
MRPVARPAAIAAIYRLHHETMTPETGLGSRAALQRDLAADRRYRSWLCKNAAARDRCRKRFPQTPVPGAVRNKLIYRGATAEKQILHRSADFTSSHGQGSNSSVGRRPWHVGFTPDFRRIVASPRTELQARTEAIAGRERCLSRETSFLCDANGSIEPYSLVTCEDSRGEHKAAGSFASDWKLVDEVYCAPVFIDPLKVSL